MKTLETIAAEIRSSRDLWGMLDALIEFEAVARCEDSDCDTESTLKYHRVDLCQLPAFGGDEPRNTDGLWSYDDGHYLVGDGPFKGWEIVDRDDEGQMWRK